MSFFENVFRLAREYLIVFLMCGLPVTIFYTCSDFVFLYYSKKKLLLVVSSNKIADMLRFAIPKQNGDASKCNRLQISGSKTWHGHNVTAKKTYKLFSCKMIFTGDILMDWSLKPLIISRCYNHGIKKLAFFFIP